MLNIQNAGGWEVEGRRSGGEVLQHVSRKLANSGTGKPRLMSQLPNGRLVTEQFVNGRAVLLIQGNIILSTSPNNWNSVAQSYLSEGSCSCFESCVPSSAISAFKPANPCRAI